MGLIDTVLVRIFHQKGEIARLAECSVRQHLDNQVEVEVIKDEASFIVRLRVVFHSSSTWLRVKGVNDRSLGQPWWLLDDGGAVSRDLIRADCCR